MLLTLLVTLFFKIICFTGHDWDIQSGLSLIVEAGLRGLSRTTDPVDISANPKFYTQITWHCDKDTIRRYFII